MIHVSHPVGNANVRGVLTALGESGMLAGYHTSLAVFSSGLMGRLAKFPRLTELERRKYDEAIRPVTSTYPFREVMRLLSLRLGVGRWTVSESAFASVYCVGAALDRQLARVVRRNSPRGVYCYEDVALATFTEAKQRGAACLYDLPIGYWRMGRRILLEEAERRPDWLPAMPGLKDSDAKLERKDEELRLADRILVASTFTKQTLDECPFPVSPIIVIPYGADDTNGGLQRAEQLPRKRSLKALFVGGLSQRKGIADLFEATEILGAHVQLTVIGRKPAEACAALNSALGKHRWIESLPREQILAEMRAHDVLVFPSLFEGFGLVVTEALSQGLPVITTPHTCGPDVLTEGEDGFIVPIRDPQAIAEKLELLHRDRDRLAAMSEAARKKAESLTWEAYRRGVVEVVRSVLDERE